MDAVPGRVHLLYRPTLELWSWNVVCVRRVKLHLPYNPVAVEKPILQRINGIRDSRGSGLIKIARTPPSPGIAITTSRVLRCSSCAVSRRGMVIGDRTPLDTSVIKAALSNQLGRHQCATGQRNFVTVLVRLNTKTRGQKAHSVTVCLHTATVRQFRHWPVALSAR